MKILSLLSILFLSSIAQAKHLDTYQCGLFFVGSDDGAAEFKLTINSSMMSGSLDSSPYFYSIQARKFDQISDDIKLIGQNFFTVLIAQNNQPNPNNSLVSLKFSAVNGQEEIRNAFTAGPFRGQLTCSLIP